MVTEDWCTINDGVYLLSDVGQQKVLDIVNSAVDVVELTVKVASRVLWLILPGSNRAFKVWDGEIWIPLQGLFIKYWAIQVTIGQLVIYKHAMPHRPIGDIMREMIAPYDAEIPGSRDWYYKDFDGTVRKGSECTPPRGYRQITDGANDLGIILIIIGILWALNSAGLYDWSSKLLSKAMTFIRNKRLNNRIATTLDLSEEIKERVVDMGTDVDVMNSVINDVGGKIGVRLVIR